MELNNLIEQYKAVRDERDKVDALLKSRMSELSQQIQLALEGAGLKSAKTEAGHAITSLRRTVRVVDWDAFDTFAAQNPALIKRSIDTSEALRLIDDNEAIPGTEVQSTFVLTIK